MVEQHPEFWRVFSDIEILIGALGALAFAISYGFFFRWTKTAPGRALMYFVVSLVTLFVIVGLARWLGPDYPGRPVITPIGYGLVTVAMWWLVWVLWRGWRKTGHALELDQKVKKEREP